MGGVGLYHPLQDPPLSESPQTDSYFYSFTITTLRTKSKIPLKMHELEGVIMECKPKTGTDHWQFFFFFSANEKMFLFSQTVLNNLSLFFLKQMHGL